MRVLNLLIIGLALTGCGTLYDAPPEKPMMKLARETPSKKWCREALLLADDPLLDPDTKDTVIERMKIRGCPMPMAA
jgi:hypothetical protein